MVSGFSVQGGGKRGRKGRGRLEGRAGAALGARLALGQEVVCQPSDLVLGTSQFAIAIAPGCAGYEGIGLMTVFAGSYLWLIRGSLRFPHAFILLPCGILVI
jgi:hypothetical protein